MCNSRTRKQDCIFNKNSCPAFNQCINTREMRYSELRMVKHNVAMQVPIGWRVDGGGSCAGRFNYKGEGRGRLSIFYPCSTGCRGGGGELGWLGLRDVVRWVDNDTHEGLEGTSWLAPYPQATRMVMLWALKQGPVTRAVVQKHGNKWVRK
jgi:hypothetical protein